MFVSFRAALFTIIAISGCAKGTDIKDNPSGEGQERLTVSGVESDAAKAVEMVAIKEVERRTGVSSESLKAEAQPNTHHWNVLVAEQPPTPGGFWVLEVNDSGIVNKFTPGE